VHLIPRLYEFYLKLDFLIEHKLLKLGFYSTGNQSC
jgi:hypothetical protein